MGKPVQADHRAYPRVRTKALVMVRRFEGRDPGLGRGVDLGIGGIRFECLGQDIELGEVIEATFVLNDDSVTVVGKAVRLTEMGPAQEVALAFKRVIEPEALQRLCGVGPGEDGEEPQA